jgi:signal transduction histidine kinase
MKMTRMTHQHMNDMRKKMDEMQQGNTSRTAKRVDGDYIDYEEVK